MYSWEETGSAEVLRRLRTHHKGDGRNVAVCTSKIKLVFKLDGFQRDFRRGPGASIRTHTHTHQTKTNVTKLCTVENLIKWCRGV